MTYKAKLRKVGGSVMVAIPPSLLEELDLAAEKPVQLAARDGKLVIEPAGRPNYSLQELLAQCDSTARMPAKDREWTDGPAKGRELI